MSGSGGDELTSDPELTEQLITPLRNRPWKYIPQFTDDECRWLRVERSSEDREREGAEEGEEEEEEEDNDDGDEGQGLLQYYRHNNRTFEAVEPQDYDMNGDLEVVELAKVVYGKRSAEDRKEVQEEPIVPVRIVRRTEVESGNGMEDGGGGDDSRGRELDEGWDGEDEPLIEVEDDAWRTSAPPPTHLEPYHLESTEQWTQGPNPGSDDLGATVEGHSSSNGYTSLVSGDGREEELEQSEVLLLDSEHPGFVADPTPEVERSRSEVVEELIVETKTVEQTRPLPVFTYTDDGETGSNGGTLVETEIPETVEVPDVSPTSGQGHFQGHHSVIEDSSEHQIQDSFPSRPEVKVSPGNKGGTLPPPGATTCPPAKPPRARRTKSETFFGFIRRKSRSKEREGGGGGGEGEGGDQNKEPGARTDGGHQTTSSTRTSPTTSRSKDSKSTQPTKTSFFQRFGFGRTSKKNEIPPDQKQNPDIPEPETDERKTIEASKASTLPKQSSAGKTNIRIFEIMGKNGNSSESTPDVSRSSSSHPVETSVRVDVVRNTVGLETKGPSSSSSAENEAGRTFDPAHVTLESGYEDGGGQSRSVLYDDNRVDEVTAGVNAPGAEGVVVDSGQSQLSAIFAKRSYIVAVAIDFGTAFSGYAFCFLRDPESIHMMGRWEDGDPGVVNQKTPTSLLLTPDGDFHSFGFTARNNYHDLSAEEAKQWLYFDRFKMALYESQNVNDSMTIEAANGKRFPCHVAIAMTLRFFKDHALQQISSQSETSILNDDVLWIVTVPAIWNASAKQLMRLAACEAGLVTPDRPDQLQIALEPEAASVHIRRLQLRHLVPEKQVLRPLSVREEHIDPEELEFVAAQFSHVVRYVVVDCGGGTVDITVHEMNFMNRRLQELHVATGGPHGSFSIDRDFERLLERIFGADLIQSYRRERSSGWIGLMMAFESRKRATDPRRTSPLNVALPFSFIEFHRKTKGTTVEQVIREYGNSGIRWSSQGMLRLSPDTMSDLFSGTLNRIKVAIEGVLSAVKGVDYMFLVGGLSESGAFQCSIRDQFRDRVRKVVIPQEANLAVIKGALAFGLDPTVIAVRRSKLTYGAAVLNRFIPGKHSESKLVTKDGVDWCRDVFDVFVRAGQVVRTGERVVRQYIPAAASQNQIVIGIYCSEEGSPGYVSDPGVRKCGNVSLALIADDSTSGPNAQTTTATRRRIQAELVFAETEIRVTATDTVTGRKVNASIDFLNV